VIVDAADGIDDALTVVTDSGLRVMARAADGWCVALDRSTMSCSIYATRPDSCRRFVMAGPYCRAVREDFARSHADVPPSPAGAA
jgi:Fe-S-cluster containining protein